MNSKYRHVLHLSKTYRDSAVKELLRHEADALSLDFDFVQFGSNHEKNFGFTHHSTNTHRADRIVINSDVDDEDKLIEESVFGKSKEYISDFDFLSHINAVYHEKSHCLQSQKLWDDSSKLGMNLVLSFLADTHMDEIRASDKYRLPSDVFVEIYALPDTYHYLQNEFYKPILMSHETLDSVFLSFVNELCYRNAYYCLNAMEPDKNKRNQYHSVDDLFNDIDLKNPESVYYEFSPPIRGFLWKGYLTIQSLFHNDSHILAVCFGNRLQLPVSDISFEMLCVSPEPIH